MIAIDTARGAGRLKVTWRLTPATAVIALIIAQIVIWTIVPYVFSTSMDIDVTADGMSWGHEWQWGYYKHPPLPSWLVEFFFDGLGDIGPFLLSQVAICLTYWLVFLLGRELMDKRRAAVGTLLIAGVYYFSIPTPMWNHNVAQMPFWAAIAFAYWKAYKSGDLRWWLALGFFAALGMLTKYSTAMLLGALALHFLTSPNARERLRSFGLYAALAVFGISLLPHALWLVRHDFPTFSYVEAQAGHVNGLGGRLFMPVRFLIAQIVDLLPAIVIAAIAGFFGPNTGRRFLQPENEADRFLLFAGVGPALLTALVSLVTGFGIRSMWGFPMWNLAGLARSSWEA